MLPGIEMTLTRSRQQPVPEPAHSQRQGKGADLCQNELKLLSDSL